MEFYKELKYYQDALLRIAQSRFPKLGISDQFLYLQKGQEAIPQEQSDAFLIICKELVEDGSYDIIFKQIRIIWEGWNSCEI